MLFRSQAVGRPQEVMPPERNVAEPRPDLSHAPYVIEAKDLTKQFGDFVATDHISFAVHKGEIFGFLGANGAGKTTAMRMLCGLSRPTAGKATVGGYDVATESEQVKKHIGYMSQKFALYDDLTVRENLMLYGGIYGMNRRAIVRKTEDVIASLQLGNQADALVKSLPLGWKQKLAFAVSIFHNPSIVFLDEPTGGVDADTRKQFWQAIYSAARSGITVFGPDIQEPALSASRGNE